MSKETLDWLNSQTLIGFTEKRGTAWHYRAEHQGSETNHYPLAIPVGDILRRLFHWEATSAPLYVVKETRPFEGVVHSDYVEVPGRQAIVRSDTRDVLGIFGSGYEPHQYRTWLLSHVGNLLDDTLGIGSAGLLRAGAQGWVSVEVPETIATRAGVDFRPNLVACTSFDGSLATTYKRVVQIVVCDNTLSAGLSEAGQVFRVKHTRNSSLRITDARAALSIVHTMADEFSAEVERLTSWEVSARQFDGLLDMLVSVPTAPGRSRTLAEQKRDRIRSLYNSDPRSAPWAGTAFGVLQAYNTYDTHYSTVRNVKHRAERNMARALTGDQASADAGVLEVLRLITTTA
ncbi:MAG: hypothetical protein QOD39_3262 [Mycobacterium sp.]|jgi:phage/plasmid-like protein (TIGR03299 family)|nr:hypothetical protein [Mycobacterium sp.]